MHNDLFTIGPVTIYGYGVMIALGVLAAYAVGTYRAKKLSLSNDHVASLTLWCLVGGLIGAKVLYWLRYDEKLDFSSKF